MAIGLTVSVTTLYLGAYGVNHLVVVAIELVVVDSHTAVMIAIMLFFFFFHVLFFFR